MMTVNGNIRWQKGVETAAQRRQAQEQKPPYRQREGHCRLLSTIGGFLRRGYVSAFQTLMCTRFFQGTCENADSNSGGREWPLRLCIFQKL